MSTLNINPKTIREGNGTDTIFSFDFPAVEKTDIQVFVKRGEEERQIPYGQFDFNVEPTADNGGEIIFPGDNSAEAVLGVGEKICIMRSSRFGNDYVFSNQSRLFPSSVEDADDALSLQILELANRLSLSVQASVFDSTTPIERWKHIQNELSQCIASAQSALAKSEEAVAKTDAEIQNRIAADTNIERAISDLDSTTTASIAAVSRAVQSEAVARDTADAKKIDKAKLQSAVTAVRNKSTAASVGIEVSSTNTDTGAVSASTVTLPVASATQHGVMPKEAYATLSNLGTRVTALEGGQSKTYAVSLGTGELTQQDYQTAWEQASGAIAGATPPDGTKLTNLDTDTDIQYFANTGQWVVRTSAVPLASQDSQGVVMGSYENGQVFVEDDGTMSVNGFDSLQAMAENAGSAVESEATRATTAEQNISQSLSGHIGDASMHTSAAEMAAWNGKYDKPATGIPASDLDTGTQGILTDALRKSVGGTMTAPLVARSTWSADSETRNIRFVSAENAPEVGSTMFPEIIMVYE